MDLTEIFSPAGLLASIPTIGIVLGFGWVIFRTESRHTLRFRLWQLVYGNREISDPIIRAHIDEQNSLMSFRFIAGVPVKNIAHAHQLIEWTRQRNVEMFALRMAGEYFDSDTRSIRTEKLPGKVMQSLRMSLAILMLSIAATSAGLVFSTSALISLKKTDTWLWLGVDSAKRLWPPFLQSPLNAAKCAELPNAAEAKTRFSEEDKRIVCSILTDKESAAFIKKTVSTQWKTCVFLFLVSLVAAWIAGSSYVSGFAAQRLARRNLDPAIEGQQLELPIAATTP